MALKEDIRDLAARTLGALNQSHDYFTYSKRVWTFPRKVVKQGGNFTFRNLATGSRVNEQTLLELEPLYLTGYLLPASFQQFVSLFEDFFFDLLRLWLTAHPSSLARKQLELGTVLKAPDKDAIVLTVVDKELNELKYDRLAEWFVSLDKLVKLGCPTPDEIEQLAEIKASRDILVHGKGIANSTYLAKAANRARYNDGEQLEIPEPYHRETWEMIRKVVGDVSEAAVKKA